MADKLTLPQPSTLLIVLQCKPTSARPFAPSKNGHCKLVDTGNYFFVSFLLMFESHLGCLLKDKFSSFFSLCLMISDNLKNLVVPVLTSNNFLNCPRGTLGPLPLREYVGKIRNIF